MESLQLGGERTYGWGRVGLCQQWNEYVFGALLKYFVIDCALPTSLNYEIVPQAVRLSYLFFIFSRFSVRSVSLW